MSTTSIRPIPRPLRLATSTSTAATSPSTDPHVHGQRSAPLKLDPTGRPAPRRQSSISYTTTSSVRRNSSDSGGSKHETRIPAAHDTEQRLSTVRDAEPVTLAEKHADLLRFIAQKESRCLELRTQLAQHEADLLQLKRKWERIVSKGGPRVAQADRSDVLDGIREGVQSGLGKVFAVLESTPAAAALQPRTSPQPATSTSITTTSSSTTSITSPAETRSKRASVSIHTPRERSSLTESASSAGSLFDDVTSFENQSSASSVLDSPVLQSDADTTSRRLSEALGRNSYAFVAEQSEGALHKDDPPGKRRRERPASVQVPQPPASSTLSAAVLPGSATTLGRQVSAWVPELNKKWEQTLSKQSKRASVLLNDVLAVLAPPAPSSALRHVPAQSVIDSAFFEPAMAAGIGTAEPRSLLDEDEGGSPGAAGKVLEPEIKSTTTIYTTKAEDDEWNW